MDVQETVRSKYGSVATSGLSTTHEGIKAVAEAFGYSEAELSSIPAEANMGLSCGNPTAFASLKEGETVVDLGSGGGLDVFLAAKRVGESGKAIGIDMTPEMIALATENAKKVGYGAVPKNVEFHLSTIDNMPMPDSSVDCIVSNCVVNLVPDKPKVFREMARVLKPGGRVAISDIALKKALPPEIEKDVMAYVGCIAGAIPIREYEEGLHGAGFSSVAIQDSGADLNAYSNVKGQDGCCSPAMSSDNALNIISEGCCASGANTSQIHSELADLLSKYDINEYAASVKVYAVKP